MDFAHFTSSMDESTPLSEIMTPRDRLVVAIDGCTLEEANELLRESKWVCIPILIWVLDGVLRLTLISCIRIMRAYIRVDVSCHIFCIQKSIWCTLLWHQTSMSKRWHGCYQATSSPPMHVSNYHHRSSCHHALICYSSPLRQLTCWARIARHVHAPPYTRITLA